MLGGGHVRIRITKVREHLRKSYVLCSYAAKKRLTAPSFRIFYKCARRQHWGSERFRLSLIGYLVVNERFSMYIYKYKLPRMPDQIQKSKKIISCA